MQSMLDIEEYHRPNTSLLSQEAAIVLLVLLPLRLGRIGILENLHAQRFWSFQTHQNYHVCHLQQS